MALLPDGTYDVFVVDASRTGDGDDEVMSLDLTILGGEHKGEVVTVQGHGLSGDELDLLGLPGTLTVANGVPSVALEP